MEKRRICKILFGTECAATVIAGTVFTIFVMAVSLTAGKYLGLFFKTQFHLDKSPLSTFLLAIILGMIVRNSFRLPESFEPGIRFCLTKLLRLGIILMGIRLSIVAVARIGLLAVGIVAVCIASGIVVSSLLARWFGVSDRIGTLIAAGTGICGVSAIIATAPTIGAKEEETAYAVSTITVFGLMATILYPFLVEWVFRFDAGQAGLFLGTAVHDTAQVTGAAYIYDQLWMKDVSTVAITTKLVRNSFLMVVVPLCAVLYARNTASEGAAGSRKVKIRKLFQFFVLGFVILALFRSVGDLFVSGESGRFLFWRSGGSWESFHGTVKTLAETVLICAIAGAGLSTQFAKLKTLSFKPFVIGLIAAMTVGIVSYFLVTLFHDPIRALVSGL